jgi:hypothetical protein
MGYDDIMELIRKQTYITEEQDRQLKHAARREGTTESEILRRALDRWLAHDVSRGLEDPFSGLIGFVEGPEDAEHDDIYR